MSAKFLQSRLTLCDPMDCSLPSSLCIWASMMAQQVKNAPAMQDTQEMWV